MRKLPVSLLAAALLVALAPAPASGGPSEDEFTFFGSGFGHGLGMSQWGAYGLSIDGWGPSRIVRHFYSGTRLATEDSPPKTLRIGLVQGKRSVRLEAQAGDVELRLEDPKQGEVVATIPEGEIWKVKAADARYRIVDASGTTVTRVGGTATPIFAVFEPNGARVRVPEAFHTYNRGWIEFGLHDCGGGCDVRLILTISPQEYLYGLAEVPSSWPVAALRAQAIAARTYAFTKAANGQHRAGCDCALYASSFDQVYAGWDKEGGTDGDRWVRAVDDTKDRVIVQGGETIQAFYMSSSGGYTEDNENVWGGTPISYLRGVCDPGDYTSSNPSAIWQVTYTARELTRALRLGVGTVTGFTNAQRGVSGRIVSVTVQGETGSVSINGSTLRSALGLRDDRVWIDANRQVTGAIREKYDALGCTPGLPRSRQVSVAGGARQKFATSTIFHADGPGAHELWGPILDRYLAEGGPKGSFGFPTTDVRTLKNGNLRVRFESGVITCKPDGSSCKTK